MSKVTVKEAALLTGKARDTINAATNDGRLSVTRSAKGTKEIDISELERVFEVVRTVDEIRSSEPVRSDTKRTITTELDVYAELAVARAKLEHAMSEREMLNTERRREREQLESAIEDLRISLRKAEEQSSKAMLLLTDQSKKHESRGAQQREEGEAMKAHLDKLERQNKVLYRKLKTLQEQTLWQRLFGRATKP